MPRLRPWRLAGTVAQKPRMPPPRANQPPQAAAAPPPPSHAPLQPEASSSSSSTPIVPLPPTSHLTGPEPGPFPAPKPAPEHTPIFPRDTAPQGQPQWASSSILDPDVARNSILTGEPIPPPTRPRPPAPESPPHHPISIPGFIPRSAFTTSHSLPKTYFLGHHAKTLRQIRDSLSLVHLIIECRDARLPLTTWNPALEAAAAGRSRIVVYTKADLLAPDAERRGPRMRAYEPVLDAAAASPGSGLIHEGAVVMQPDDRVAGRRLLKLIARVSREKDILTGLCAMVVGMPNVGKSTLLNFLRAEGMKDSLKDGDKDRDGGGSPRRKKMPKVAKTGQQPGITRSVSTGVRVLDIDPPVYVKDTPGVFVPYMPDPEAMIKVALVAGIKANLVPDAVLADYLLYRLNLINPRLYARFNPVPTNDVGEWLQGIARSAHMLRPGGVLDLERAATFMIHRFRSGQLGRFPLDDLSEGALEKKLEAVANPPTSLNQFRKEAKEMRKRASKERYQARTSGGGGGGEE